MRKWLFLSYDLAVMASAPFVALFMRYDYDLAWSKAMAIQPYALVGVVASALCFLALSTHRTLWRHVSLPDFIRILTAVTAAISIALVLDFAFFRLEGVPRNVPPVQWAIAVAAMAGARLLTRGILRPGRNKRRDELGMHRDHALVVGIGHVAELYLRCVADLAGGRIAVEGLLHEQPSLKGRLLYNHKVIGRPADLRDILGEFRTHGVEITHIIIAVPFHELTQKSRDALLHWERSGAVTLDLFEERLGFRPPANVSNLDAAGERSRGQSAQGFDDYRTDLNRSGYAVAKRTIDILGSFFLIIALSPLIAVASLLTLISLGYPVVFWQQRPGRYGVPFRLYKFRTMRPKFDADYGNRASNNQSDEQRITAIGRFLRRTRLDELPQLYHILVGEMSFIGPRPLLPAYQPKNGRVRLSVRPGVTGWAQVHGGDLLMAEDKLVLDVWYLNKMSLAIDIKIAIKTLMVAARGDRVDRDAIAWAKRQNDAASGQCIGRQPDFIQQFDAVDAKGNATHWTARQRGVA